MKDTGIRIESLDTSSSLGSLILFLLLIRVWSKPVTSGNRLSKHDFLVATLGYYLIESGRVINTATTNPPQTEISLPAATESFVQLNNR